MDGDGTGTWASEVLLTRVHELFNNGVRRGRSVGENHVLMVDALLQEVGAVVLGLVQAYNLRHIQVLEDVDVAGSRMAIAMN